MGMDDQTRSHRVGGEYPGSDWGTEEHKNRFAVGLCFVLLLLLVIIPAALWWTRFITAAFG